MPKQKKSTTSYLSMRSPVGLKASGAPMQTIEGISRMGTITLDDPAQEQRQSYPAASFRGAPVAALYCATGNAIWRSLIA